jgi:hypothetical protein
MIHPGAFSLAMFTALTSLVLLVFASYHLSLVARGLTSNESFKHADLRNLTLYRKELEEEAGAQHNSNTTATTANGENTTHAHTLSGDAQVDYFQGHPREAVDLVFRYGADRRTSQQLELLATRPSLYHRGWADNLCRVLFPARLSSAAEKGRSAERRTENRVESGESVQTTADSGRRSRRTHRKLTK